MPDESLSESCAIPRRMGLIPLVLRNDVSPPMHHLPARSQAPCGAQSRHPRPGYFQAPHQTRNGVIHQAAVDGIEPESATARRSPNRAKNRRCLKTTFARLLDPGRILISKFHSASVQGRNATPSVTAVIKSAQRGAHTTAVALHILSPARRSSAAVIWSVLKSPARCPPANTANLPHPASQQNVLDTVPAPFPVRGRMARVNPVPPHMSLRPDSADPAPI